MGCLLHPRMQHVCLVPLATETWVAEDGETLGAAFHPRKVREISGPHFAKFFGFSALGLEKQVRLGGGIRHGSVEQGIAWTAGVSSRKQQLDCWGCSCLSCKDLLES